MNELNDSGRPAPRAEPAQRDWIGWIQIAGIVAVIALSALITVWLSSGQNDAGAPPPDQTVAPVRVVQPEQSDHQVRLSATGTVTVTAFVELTPQVGGRIIEVSPAARDGGAFQAGDILFRIDPRDYEVAIRRAQAALADARAALQTEDAQAQIARTEWSSLYPDREITPLAAREPQLEAARARLMSAEADLAQARLNLERTQFSLPFDGRIADSRIEAGRLATAGQALGSAYDTGTLEIVAPVAPEELGRLAGALGRRAEIRIEGADQPLSGSVARIGARLDDWTRFVDLFVQTEGSEGLRPGLFAEVSLFGPTLEDVYVLPGAALAGLDTVRLVEGGRVVEREVRVLDRLRDQVIVAPFDPGQGIIISALPEAAIGREVEIVDGAR